MLIASTGSHSQGFRKGFLVGEQLTLPLVNGNSITKVGKNILAVAGQSYNLRNDSTTSYLALFRTNGSLIKAIDFSHDLNQNNTTPNLRVVASKKYVLVQFFVESEYREHIILFDTLSLTNELGQTSSTKGSIALVR